MFNLIPNAGKSEEQRKAENEARAQKCREWKANEGKDIEEALASLSEEEKQLMNNSTYSGVWVR